MWSVGCGVRGVGCVVRVAGCGGRSADCGLQGVGSIPGQDLRVKPDNLDSGTGNYRKSLITAQKVDLVLFVRKLSRGAEQAAGGNIQSRLPSWDYELKIKKGEQTSATSLVQVTSRDICKEHCQTVTLIGNEYG